MEKSRVILDEKTKQEMADLCTPMTYQEVGSWYDYINFRETAQQTVTISRCLNGYLIFAEWDDVYYLAETLEQVRETLDMLILNWSEKAKQLESESQQYWLENQDEQDLAA